MSGPALQLVHDARDAGRIPGGNTFNVLQWLAWKADRRNHRVTKSMRVIASSCGVGSACAVKGVGVGLSEGLLNVERPGLGTRPATYAFLTARANGSAQPGDKSVERAPSGTLSAEQRALTETHRAQIDTQARSDRHAANSLMSENSPECERSSSSPVDDELSPARDPELFAARMASLRAAADRHPSRSPAEREHPRATL